MIVRLDERDHHAVCVGGGEIDGRAAMHRARRRHRDAVARDALRQLVEPRRIEQLRRGDASCAPGRRHGRARRRRRASAPRSARCSISGLSGGRPAMSQAVEHAERDQRGDALAVRRDLVDAMAAGSRRRSDRRSRQVCAARSSVGDRSRRRPSPRARSSRRSRRDRSPRLRSRRSRVSVFAWSGGRKCSPGSGARPCGRKASAKPGCAVQPLDLVRPDLRDDRRDEEAVARIADRRLEERGEGELAEAPAERHPGGDGAGDRGGVPALVRHRRAVEALRASRRPASGRRRSGRCSLPPSQTMAKRSLPRPLLTGSTTVSAIAVAIAASTALPPFCSIESPACAASGCVVATQFRASTGMRREG